MTWLPYPGGYYPHLGMGHFHVSIEVSHRAGGRVVTVKALVDTGATYTQIPRDVLEGLGLRPEQEWPFELADGREVLYPIAWITVRLRGQQQPTIAVFGEPDTEPILGVVTLEEFRVAADPVRGRLVPVPGRMKRARDHRARRSASPQR